MARKPRRRGDRRSKPARSGKAPEGRQRKGGAESPPRGAPGSRSGRLPPRLALLIVIAVVAVLVVVFRGPILSRFAPLLTAPEGRPNVVLITLDTTRDDRLGCYGYRNAETPNLDRLAAQGVLFENARCQVPITQPSHCSIMTGTNPTYHGVVANMETMRDEGITTLAEVFGDAGYETCAVIAAFVVASRFGLGQGFDHYFEDFATPTGSGRFEEKKAEEVVRTSVNWLKSRGDSEFFLWVHLYDPHDPYEPPPPYARTYRERPYDGEIAYMDHWIGKLLDAMREEQLARNTIVAVVGDHGESLGEHAEDTHGYFLYNSSVSIPLMFWAPGLIPSSVRVPHTVRSVDVAPTILELAGLPIPDAMQGTTLAWAMTGDDPPLPLPLPCFSISEELNRSFSWATLRALEYGDHKYVRLPTPELYDLKQDPGELQNLAGAHPERVQELDSLLTEIIETTQSDAPREAEAPLDPESLERLMSLGYVTGGRAREPAAFDEGVAGMIDPKDRLDFWNEFRRLLKHRSGDDFDDVVQLGRSLIDQDPDALIVAYYLAQALYMKSETERSNEGLREAAEHFAKAAELPEFRIPCLISLGTIHGKLNEYEQARSVFEEVLRLNPDDPMAHHNLVLVYHVLGDWEGVIRSGEKALALIPNHPRAQTVRQTISNARRRLEEE